LLDIIKTIIEKLLNLETNITAYERMENKYKIGRRKFILLAASLLLLLSFNTTISYLLIYKYYDHMYLVIISALILISMLSIFLRRHLLKAVMVMFYIVLPVFTKIQLVLMYTEGFSIENFFLSIILILFTLLAYSSAYLFVRDKLIVGDIVNLTFIVSDEHEPINAKLISITKQGDYIIQLTENEDEEILLNKDYVKKVIYRK